jgi:hypothetical protein
MSTERELMFLNAWFVVQGNFLEERVVLNVKREKLRLITRKRGVLDFYDNR